MAKVMPAPGAGVRLVCENCGETIGIVRRVMPDGQAVATVLNAVDHVAACEESDEKRDRSIEHGR